MINYLKVASFKTSYFAAAILPECKAKLCLDFNDTHRENLIFSHKAC